jgi:hypothetical protein
MSASAKRGRPPRHPIDVLRTKVWFASLKEISGLPSAYAIEMAICPTHAREESDDSSRPRKFSAYANGQRVPKHKGGKPGIIDVAEARFPGSAATFDCPLWDLLGKKHVDDAWSHDAYCRLLFTSEWPARVGGDPSCPRQFCDGPEGVLSDFLTHLERLTMDLLLWRISENIGSIELQHSAIDNYLMRQLDLAALPELAGDLASELFHAIDTAFPHWVQSGYRRNKIVVLTNELRAASTGQVLTRRDINRRIAELR